MKRLIPLILIFMLALPALAEADIMPVTMYAVSAGKADSVIIAGNGYSLLIDTGYAYTRGKILYAMERLGISGFDAVFLTHTDHDHADGLEWLSESDIYVGAWYTSAFYTDTKPDKHPMSRACRTRGAEMDMLRCGDELRFGGDTLKVLAPSVLFNNKENNNSLVMMLETAYGKILLCGDMEYEEEALLLDNVSDLKCDIMKVANHADDDTCSAEFIEKAVPRIAVISTDSFEKPSTPDPFLVNRLEDAGARICETQDAEAGIMLTLGSEIDTSYMELPKCGDDISIRNVDTDNDTVEIYAGVDADLSDWYLYSDKGGEMYIFKDTTIKAGESITLGKDDWNGEKFINKKKTDNLTLYDKYGNAVDSMSNGR